jgi:transposase
MDTIGLDLHKRESQLCILAPDGTAREQRIVTSRERFTAVLGPLAPATVLLEASTESEWVARHLEALGLTVIVADPNYAPMYATRARRVKTDRRDARTLAEACRLGAYRPAHRLSDAQRHVRADLAVRDAVVRTRTRYVALIKAAVRREGLRLTQGDPERTAAKLAAARRYPRPPRASSRRSSRSSSPSTRRSPTPTAGSRRSPARAPPRGCSRPCR